MSRPASAPRGGFDSVIVDSNAPRPVAGDAGSSPASPGKLAAVWDVAPLTALADDVRRLLAPRADESRPWGALFQPLDVVMFGLVHFWLGAVVGWAIDARWMGPPDEADRTAHWSVRLGRIVQQMVVVLLAFNYLRRGLLLLRPRYGIPGYQHATIGAMDGGFAMSMGFAWTQRNLVRRFHGLVDDWWGVHA